jgi:hypothetical protein
VLSLRYNDFKTMSAKNKNRGGDVVTRTRYVYISINCSIGSVNSELSNPSIHCVLLSLRRQNIIL